MTDGEQKAIASLPFGIFGTVRHGMKIRNSQNIGNTERLGDIALSLHLTHFERVTPDAISPLF